MHYLSFNQQFDGIHTRLTLKSNTLRQIGQAKTEAKQQAIFNMSSGYEFRIG